MNNKIFRHFFTNYAPLMVPAFFLADCNGGSWFPATGQKLRHYQIIRTHLPCDCSISQILFYYGQHIPPNWQVVVLTFL